MSRAPGRVDEPEDRHLLVDRRLGGPDHLLDGARAPRSGLDHRIVGDDDDGHPFDRPAPGDHAIGRQRPAVVRGLVVGEQAVLDERLGVEEEVDALACRQLVLPADLGERPLVGLQRPFDRRVDLFAHRVPTVRVRGHSLGDRAASSAAGHTTESDAGAPGTGHPVSGDDRSYDRTDAHRPRARAVRRVARRDARRGADGGCWGLRHGVDVRPLQRTRPGRAMVARPVRHAGRDRGDDPANQRRRTRGQRRQPPSRAARQRGQFAAVVGARSCPTRRGGRGGGEQRVVGGGAGRSSARSPRRRRGGRSSARRSVRCARSGPASRSPGSTYGSPRRWP